MQMKHFQNGSEVKIKIVMCLMKISQRRELKKKTLKKKASEKIDYQNVIVFQKLLEKR